MTRTPDQLRREIDQCLALDPSSPSPDPSETRMTRQARFVKEEIERRTGGTVEVGPISSLGGHSLDVRDPGSGHRQTFGVSKYGITPGTVWFGSKHKGGDKFIKILRATINRAGKVK